MSDDPARDKTIKGMEEGTAQDRWSRCVGELAKVLVQIPREKRQMAFDEAIKKIENPQPGEPWPS